MIQVVEVATVATIQDLGRVGMGHLGVPRAGPVDEASHRLANRLVGNCAQAATLEILTGVSTVFQFRDRSYIALGGAPAALTVNGRAAAIGRPLLVPAGARVAIGRPVFGLWSYLAVRGGVGVRPILGSRATDSLSGLGPRPLAAGDELPVSDAVAGSVSTVDAHSGVSQWATVTLHVTPGPRHSWFTPEAHQTLVRTAWRVSPDTNRIAARLEGPALSLKVHRQLPTEGLHLGSIQVPSSGIPIVHLANHPPTGGYPVIAIVEPSDLSRLAQCPPGTQVHVAYRSSGPPRPVVR